MKRQSARIFLAMTTLSGGIVPLPVEWEMLKAALQRMTWKGIWEWTSYRAFTSHDRIKFGAAGLWSHWHSLPLGVEVPVLRLWFRSMFVLTQSIWLSNSWQTLENSFSDRLSVCSMDGWKTVFSAVSKPSFATKYSLELALDEIYQIDIPLHLSAL